MKLIALLRDALVRVVKIREALEDGDPDYAAELARDLEIDLAAGLATIGDDEPRFCLADFNTIPSRGPGDERTAAWCRAYLAGIEADNRASAA